MRVFNIRIFVSALFIFALALIGAGCGGAGETAKELPAGNNPKERDPAPEPTETTEPPESGGAVVKPVIFGSAAEREACYETNTGDYPVLRSQTFAIEFEPFKGTCFITIHNPEYDDPPMESEFAIYRKNRKIFDFPEQFNGVTAGCWVEAIGFQDLNGDGLIDVIVVGKCPARSGPYQENMVYANTGKGFRTNLDANDRLSKLKTVQQIADHVRENKLSFFK